MENFDYSVTTTTTDLGSLEPFAAVLTGGMLIVSLIIGLAVYVYTALALMKIAERTKTPNGWFAWIPILNVVLMLQIAKMHWAWVFLIIGCVIPILNFIAIIALVVVMIMATWKICERRKRPGWWALLTLIPGFGSLWQLIMYGILAWSKE